MYDYMKALQKRFDHQEYPELAEQVERAQEELRRNMDAAEREEVVDALQKLERVEAKTVGALLFE